MVGRSWSLKIRLKQYIADSGVKWRNGYRQRKWPQLWLRLFASHFSLMALKKRIHPSLLLHPTLAMSKFD